ncbi:MAG: hypothetical protein KAJ19_23520 [Gammaproteobacteria bacterium]|nr:hypothetical protein [Gammaproteobacteria bacterium]
MRYINTTERRLLIAMRMVKKWVAPKQVVNLSPIDIRMLGANGAFMRPATPEEISEATSEAAIASAPMASGAAAPKKTDDKADRKALKEALEDYTKAGLVDIAKGLDVEVKSRDNMAAITKKIMAAAKKTGYVAYAAVLKKVN